MLCIVHRTPPHQQRPIHCQVTHPVRASRWHAYRLRTFSPESNCWYFSLGSGTSYVTLIDHTVTQINHALIPINHVSTVIDRPRWAGSLYRWNIHWLQKQMYVRMYVRMYVWWCRLAQRDAVIFWWDMVFESPIIVSLFKYLARMTWHPT